MSKRLWSLMGILVIAALVLAACKPSPTPPPTEEVTEAPTEEVTEAPTEEPTPEEFVF
ncbi:MAG TPA: ABC transporter substrate-binding protein, partial [Anaerolineae bacterium]|nr:ABC transporter substrate-binding protein [Anaerolineae bacterium]